MMGCRNTSEKFLQGNVLVGKMRLNGSFKKSEPWEEIDGENILQIAKRGWKCVVENWLYLLLIIHDQ